MKRPMNPPATTEILHSIGAERLTRIIRAGIGPTPTGRYLHWDELRHRNPPAGLDASEWWAGVKLARSQLYKQIEMLTTHNDCVQFAMVDPVVELLHRLDSDARGQIEASSPIVTPELRHSYLVRSLMEEAITSSQLEGASTTRAVAKELLRSGRQPRDRSEQMIFNNYLAMEYVRDHIQEPISPELVFELHRIVTQDTLDDPSAAGRFRRPDEEINVVNAQHTEILYEPPPAKELDGRLKRLCRFANDQQQVGFIHPLIKATLVHFMIGYDHPFVDGNGRTARALFYWYAVSKGYWLLEFVSISAVLKRAPANYGRAYLFTETDESDATYFILDQLQTLLTGIKQLHEYLRQKALEQRNVDRILATSPRLRELLNHRQSALLNNALKHPGTEYTVRRHQRMHNVVYQTARTDLLGLAKLRLLDQRRSGNTFIFSVPLDLSSRLGNLTASERKTLV